MWRHKERKSLYYYVGKAKVQVSGDPLVDYDDVVVYRSHPDNMLWVRKNSEFYDGRFEEVRDDPEPSARMMELQRCAKLLFFVLDRCNYTVPDFVVDAKENRYTTETRCETMLYETLQSMTYESRDWIVYHHKDARKMDLAGWWEKHCEMQLIIEKDREIQRERDEIKQRALAKLTAEERTALGYK